MAKPNAKQIDADDKRTEIVKQAFDVFYRNGFHAAGVNSLLEGTGISKRTLYKYFDSKEDLIRSTVQYYRDRTSKTIEDFVEAKAVEPREKILRIFDWYEGLMESGHKLGCFAIKAKLEFAGQDKKIEAACESFFTRTQDLIERLCRDAQVKSPQKVAKQIELIFQGVVVNAQITQSSESARIAKAAARAVLDGV